MEQVGLVFIIAGILIGAKFFLRGSRVLSWIVGILLLVSLAYTTYQGAGVLSENPIYILYGLLATTIGNAFCILLSFADKKNKLGPIVKGSPLSNPLVKGATLCVLLLLQIHLYGFLLYRFSGTYPEKGDLLIPLLLSFISGILLINIYRDFRTTGSQNS